MGFYHPGVLHFSPFVASVFVGKKKKQLQVLGKKPRSRLGLGAIPKMDATSMLPPSSSSSFGPKKNGRPTNTRRIYGLLVILGPQRNWQPITSTACYLAIVNERYEEDEGSLCEELTVTRFPTSAVTVMDKLYSTDVHLQSAFRHEIGVPANFYPEGNGLHS
jgi:hypothetical protein